jgi:hypothetical protein
MKPIKLTKPQEKFLRELAIEPRFVASQYKPGRRLLAIGFAEGIGWKKMAATDAGREWIKERDAK